MMTSAIVAGIKADLDNITFNDNLLVFLMGNTAIGDADFRVYGFDSASTATADGNFVIRPSMYVSTAGRLIRRNWDQYYNDLRFKSIGYTPSAAEVISALGFSPVQSVFGRTGIITATNGDYNTSQVTELLNLYYTDARSRAAHSAGTGISYNSTTGVITNSSPDQTVVLSNGNRIAVAGTYPNFTIAYVEPTASSATRTLNSNFTISSTKQAIVNYSVSLSATNPLIAGTSSAAAYLEYSTNAGSSWIPVSDGLVSSGVGVAVAVAITNTQTQILSGVIPANALVRIRTATSGTASVVYVRGQETY